MTAAILPRAALVDHARTSIAKGSKSFAAASQLFDRKTRERAWLLYAWCRKCDDIADGQDHGGALSNDGDAAARLARIRALTARALSGVPSGDPAFDAFGVVARECGIPAAYAEDLIAGFALDAADWRPQTEADMLRYCYHVAGVVGQMMALVMGVSPDDAATLKRACDLGYAFQIANIARDVREDADAGRCYVPQDWLRELRVQVVASPGADGGHDADFWAPSSAAIRWHVAGRLAALAAGYEESARIGARALPLRSRWAVLAAAGIYGGIAREVARRGAHAWDQRVITSKAAKLGYVARALVEAL